MLYEWLYPLSVHLELLNLFKYLTFRSGGAMVSALALSLWLGPKLIQWLKCHQQGGQPIREDGPTSHLENKKGTPTMGGLLILGSFFISTLLWTDIRNPYVHMTCLVTFLFGLLGFIDDYLKVTKRNSKGISGKTKLFIQIITAVLIHFWLQAYVPPLIQTKLFFPFFKNLIVDLSWFFPILVTLVVVGASNAVNLTDGLDGLVIVPVMIVCAAFALISYLVGHFSYASYLQLPHVPGTGELAVLCSALIGAGLGFLWFNAPPAKIFMGDTGSLALGGALGTMSVITKHEIVLAITGGLFVIEALSVIIQVYYFKLSGGKRIFHMAPIHHHFEKKGWSESTIVIRFWIIAVIFALIGLSSLKIR
jgi:phospho-N-acetylmuramoyl-pentapeptide-transferase